MINYEIPGLPSYGPIAHLVGRCTPKYSSSKLCNDDLTGIMNDYDNGMLITHIAKKWSVSRFTVAAVVNGKRTYK